MGDYSLWIVIGYIIALLQLLSIVLACVTFVFRYRPWNIAKHGRAGRHLLSMTYVIMGLAGLVLFNELVSIPVEISIILQIIVLSALSYACWDRVALLRYSSKEAFDNKEKR